MKRFVLGSATAIGSDWTGTLLADISPGAYSGNVLTFKLSDYPALQQDYGSMRFSLFGEGTNDGIIIINRIPGDVFYAVSARCTHEGGTVDAYIPDPENPDIKTIICQNHVSVYDFQGRYQYGPSQQQANLPTFATSYANGILKVELPKMNLRINRVTVASVNGNTKRLQLSFPARQNGTYKLRFTPDLTTPPISADFAITAAGSATKSEITPAINGNQNIWVDSTRKRGFYLIELDVKPF